MNKNFGNITHVELKGPAGELVHELEYFIEHPEDGTFRLGLGSLRPYSQAEVDAKVSEGEFIPLPEKAYIQEGQQVIMYNNGEIFVANQFAELCNRTKAANRTLIGQIVIPSEVEV